MKSTRALTRRYFRRAYYGLKSEDSTIAYGFYGASIHAFIPLSRSYTFVMSGPARSPVWETLEQHQKFMNNRAEYQPMLDAIKAMFDLPHIAMIHIKTSIEPYAALEAPVLEVATCSLHPGRTIEELESVLNQLVDLANSDKSPVSPVLATSGRIVENDHTMIFLMGWPSDQVRLLYTSLPR